MGAIDAGIQNGDHLPGTRVTFSPGQVCANLRDTVVEQRAQESVFADAHHLRKSCKTRQLGFIDR